MKLAFVTQNFFGQPQRWSNLLLRNYLSALGEGNAVAVDVYSSEFAAGSGKAAQNIRAFKGQANAPVQDSYLAYADEVGVALAPGDSYSKELVDHLLSQADSYDLICYFHDNFSPLWLGVPQLTDKAALFTCWDMRQAESLVARYSPLFHSLKGVCFFSEEERFNFESFYPIPEHITSRVAGWATRTSRDDKVRTSRVIVVCDDGTDKKMSEAAVQCLAEVRSDYKIDHTFALITPETSRQEAEALIKDARALVLTGGETQVPWLFAGWRYGKPVILPGGSEKLRYFCDQSGGAMYYNSKAMLRGLLAWTLQYDKESVAIGEAGSSYVNRNNGQPLLVDFITSLSKGKSI